MFNKFIVQAYKVIGFVALTSIMIGLASYFVINVFYFVNHSWAAPMILSPSDKRVLELNAQLAQQASLRDSLSAQRIDLEVRMQDAKRVMATEASFQAALKASVDSDVKDREASLGKMAVLAVEHQRTGKEIAKANEEFVGLSKDQIKEMYAAKLLTREDAVKGNLQIAELANANLGLSVKNVELDNQMFLLRREIDSMKLAGSTLDQAAPASGRALSQPVLASRHEFDRASLEIARAKDAEVALKQSLDIMGGAIARYDTLLKSIKDSPYLQAVDRHLTVAFVPYDNVAAAKNGTPVYACKANIVWCKKAGKVVQTLDGEVVGKHPTQNIELRGVIVQMELDDIHLAENPVIHLGRAPLFL